MPYMDIGELQGPRGWPSHNVTCIGSKVGHQIVSLALIALWALSVSIDFVSPSARVRSVKSAKGLGVSDGHTDPKIGPQVYLGLIKQARKPRSYASLKLRLTDSLTHKGKV